MTQRIASRRPQPEEISFDYHRELIARVEGESATAVLHQQLFWICDLAGSVSTEQVDRVHAPYSWTIRQVFEHCANAERMFGYRIMCIADGSEPDLPAWDENVSADSRFGLGNFSRLVTELGELRQANLLLLERLVPSAWDCAGTASGHRITVRALAWLAAGHLLHHFEIVENRCSVTAKRMPDMVK
ncbi:DinB family protein [Roseiconus lacunae]|uniref:DinB family protein n=1 Tax=Roseiconus lacunae TaxID=2605694 RepID=A0ABT7PFZ6_9BACT|nr:DinB family protein [Roseiconus lacunae]MCD0460533.1 DinB family protein [Roseiconus lacunae]MDM4015419.1 DinB family protein [Roseiconus lacunae]WRQ52903.1 DinB family protein [Stieleria sp. HD01]